MFLWLHVITVELLRKRFNIRNPSDRNNLFWRCISQISNSPAKQKAIDYVNQWGDSFWQESEERILEFSERLESQLQSAVGADVGLVSASVNGELNISNEKKTEIVERANKVVNQVQLKELMHLIDLLAKDIFVDHQSSFYVVIDGLDEDWAEDQVRYRLIKALIESVRKFQSVRPVKIVICLRSDLLHKVLEATKTTGSQEEKYESLYLRIFWSKEELKELLDRRVNFLFRRKYTGTSVGIDELLPSNQMKQKSSVEYILERSFLRPRDVIHFINECMKTADGRGRFTTHTIWDAERSYSTKRLRSVCDEWRSSFPNLVDYAAIVEGRPRRFFVKDVSENDLEPYVVKCLSATNRVRGPMYEVAKGYLDSRISKIEFLAELFEKLYLTGIVGVNTVGYEKVHWSYLDDVPITKAQLGDDYEIYVHPVFWNALGIKY